MGVVAPGEKKEVKAVSGTNVNVQRLLGKKVVKIINQV